MIVVGVDFSLDSRAALRWAEREGRAMHSAVVAVHAGPPVYEPLAHTPIAEQRRANMLPTLDGFCIEATGNGGAERRVVDGPAAEALVKLSTDAELVVVGRQGLGAIARMLLGSVSHDVVRAARCPVVIVPPTANDERPERIVVGTDGSDHAAAAVRWAARDAVRHGVPLHVVHAGSPPLAAEIAEKAAADIGGAVPVEAVESSLDPAAALIAESSLRSVLVVGSRGIGGLSRALLGSTSLTCVERAACPVVVVPFG